MLDFTDAPYRYFPPRYFPPTAWVLRQFNRLHYLPKTNRIAFVGVEGEAFLEPALRGRAEHGDAIVLMPNHPTHCDAPIFVEACRQVGLMPRTMAAYDVFLRSRATQWVMQRLGCFSVDREGSDKQGLTEALRTLIDTPHPLTVFPEGNVYLENDRVTPFNDGAAFLAVRAAKKLVDEGRNVWCIPVAIKVKHTTDCRALIWRRLQGIAKDLNLDLDLSLEPGSSDEPVAAMVAIGRNLLERNLKHRGLNPPEQSNIAEAARAAASQLIEPLERKLEIKPKNNETLLNRIRACRRMIHSVRTDDTRRADHRAAAGWADEAILAFRLASYSGDYAGSRPTVDRIGETVEKLYEDLYDQPMPPYADRSATVCFGESLNVNEALEDEPKTKRLVQAITTTMEQRVQASLDAINERDKSHGGSLWQQA